MDFSVITGKCGYLLWKTGIVGFWQGRMLRKQRTV